MESSKFLSIQHHPPRGAIVCVNFDQGFRVPEMVKRRLCVVLSPPIKNRVGLCTIVPLSKTTPATIMPYHYEFQIPFQMPPSWGNESRWVKGDMICAVGHHRIDLLRLGKDDHGQRRYQLQSLSQGHLTEINKCVLNSLGMEALTIHI